MTKKLFTLDQHSIASTRRWFFDECGVGLARVAATSLMGSLPMMFDRSTTLKAAEQLKPLAPKPAHHSATAKRVIYIFQAGAPSQHELFDYKPELAKRDGQLPPSELLEGYRAAFINPKSALLGSRYPFKRYGECGMELSELIPNIGDIADEICMIRSMQTDAINHAPGQMMMNTGSEQFGRPSFGSWALYGLGSEAEDLPGFVVLTSAKGTSGGSSNYGCGFLPTVYGGTPFRSARDPVLYLTNPNGIDRECQRASLDTINTLNSIAEQQIGDPEIEARIQSYEMAFRLQSSAPELMDLSTESADTLSMYGIKDVKEATFARNCLLARRLIERGVRFVQLFNEVWDHHGGLTAGIKNESANVDKPSAALVRDLKQRGLLDDTLVVWGGEFGRTPMVQGGNDGRDHHNRCFSVWMAGGGVKSGFEYGKTDELGFNVIENPVHVHDLNATLLHLLGFDHTQLTYRFQGRDFRLTDVHGNIITDILS